MRLCLVLSVLSVVLAPAWASNAQSSALSGCVERLRQTIELDNLPPGPLTLKRVVCHPWRSSHYSWTSQEVSPDGKSVAAYGSRVGLVVAPMAEAGAPQTIPVELGPSGWGLSMNPRGALKWDANSKSLWTARQDRAKPAGWATSPMRPVKATPTAVLQELAPLRHPAGPLDALWWIDGRGLALAQFGTRGFLYRPEHDDPSPTVAFIDASKGRVLDTLRLDQVDPSDGKRGTRPLLKAVASTVLPNGKPRVFLSLRKWVIWTAGLPARTLDDPYQGTQRATWFALSPDGSKLLVSLALPTTTVCPRIPPCTRGPMVRGPVAALHDLRNGRVLWTVEAEDDWGSAPAAPAVSPDGKIAMVGLPPRQGEPNLAVVSMKDGRVLQRIRANSDRRAAYGFSADGRTAWVALESTAVFFDVR
ncbi:MAG: hypothetical protein U1C74_23545 [Phenylobacterium sp.]|nr:hypothetical protein [Phenylobacterium sp.]